MITSKLCNAADFATNWYRLWAPAVSVGITPPIHRKAWEFAVVTQALHERGYLQPGKRGIGFAVGTEPLPALFANLGCHVLATDNYEDDGSWTGQFAVDKSSLIYPDICPPEVFERNVEFGRIDMMDIPATARGFDFSWSCCALEHLWTLANGLDFIEKQMDCLKPGGLAVHTTEFNLSSDTLTPDNDPVCVYRKRDILAFAERMAALGHTVVPADFTEGQEEADRYVALPRQPGTHRSFLRLFIGPYVCTSIVLLIEKGGA